MKIGLIVLKSIYAGVNLNEELDLNRCKCLNMMVAHCTTVHNKRVGVIGWEMHWNDCTRASNFSLSLNFKNMKRKLNVVWNSFV